MAGAIHAFLEVVTVAAAQVLHHVEVHASLEMAAAAAHWQVIAAAAVAHWQVLRCVGLDWRFWAVALAESLCVYGIAAPGTGGQHQFQEQIFWHCVDDE